MLNIAELRERLGREDMQALAAELAQNTEMRQMGFRYELAQVAKGRFGKDAMVQLLERAEKWQEKGA